MQLSWSPPWRLCKLCWGRRMLRRHALQAEGAPQAPAELQAQIALTRASLADLRTSLSAQLGEGTAGRCCLPFSCVLCLLPYLPTLCWSWFMMVPSAPLRTVAGALCLRILHEEQVAEFQPIFGAQEP